MFQLASLFLIVNQFVLANKHHLQKAFDEEDFRLNRLKICPKITVGQATHLCQSVPDHKDMFVKTFRF